MREHEHDDAHGLTTHVRHARHLEVCLWPEKQPGTQGVMGLWFCHKQNAFAGTSGCVCNMVHGVGTTGACASDDMPRPAMGRVEEGVECDAQGALGTMGTGLRREASRACSRRHPWGQIKLS